MGGDLYSALGGQGAKASRDAYKELAHSLWSVGEQFPVLDRFFFSVHDNVFRVCILTDLFDACLPFVHVSDTCCHLCLSLVRVSQKKVCGHVFI